MILDPDDLIETVAQQLDSWTIALASASSKSGQQWDVSQELVSKAEDAITQAVVDALAHVAIVRKNNSTKEWTEILSRSDVQEALSQPFLDAQESVTSAINQAWASGQSAGWKAASAELKALGLATTEMPELSDATLTQILGDAGVNAHEAQSRFEQALLSDKPLNNAHAVGTQLQLRARLGASSAGQFAYNEAKEVAYANHPGLQKTWVAHFSPTTCKYCRWLHGQTVPIGESFPLPPGARVPYTGQLLGPQYHPNCRCSLLPHMSGKTQPEKLQAGALVDGAQNDTPPPPEITSAAIKAIPQSKMVQVLQWLIKWFGGS